MVRAFRDTWELGIHSYLTYLRDRLLLARDLLHESGSVFVQISDENLHHVRELMDEAFGIENFSAQIAYKSTDPLGQKGLARVYDYILWYAKDKERMKFRPAFRKRDISDDSEYRYMDDASAPSGYRVLTGEEFDQLAHYDGVFRRRNITSSGFTESCTSDLELDGKLYPPPGGKSWSTNVQGVQNLKSAKRLFVLGKDPYFKQYQNDFPWSQLENCWTDKPAAKAKLYVVQTAEKFIQRCLLMTTDPGDLVFDPTCGSGTTAFVAEQWGRRWITCDTSRVATTLAKQRLMGATFDYYKLAHPNEGVGSGFEYKKVPHVTLKSIANNEPPSEETLYDQPLIDNSRARISGPFTVEAVPAPNVKSLDDLGPSHSAPPPSAVIPNPVASFANGGEGSAVSSPSFSPSHSPADASIARSGPTLRQSDWRDELLKSGLRGKGGQMINFSRVEPLGGTRWLHADAETKGVKPERVVISFGPDYAPLVTTQVEMAWEEARTLHPKPEILVFAAFQFDPEAAKDIDDLTKEKTGMTFLTAQMNADLLTDDLKKKRSSNQSFWLVGRPDVEIRPAPKSDLACHPEPGRPVLANGGEGSASLFVAEVRGFDYYNTRTGTIESGDTTKIAMWLLDTDYDGRSLYPRQVFFPLADEDEGWAKLARNLKAEIDLDLIEKYRGTISLPFALGDHKRVAVKVIDDRGIESLKVLQL
jgi:adenine-specific DNA-methyltransferase